MAFSAKAISESNLIAPLSLYVEWSAMLSGIVYCGALVDVTAVVGTTATGNRSSAMVIFSTFAKYVVVLDPFAAFVLPPNWT